MKIFWSNRAWRAAIVAEIKQQPDASDLLLLYSENPELLRKALAGYQNVDEAALKRCNVSQNSLLFTPLSRALRAFAEGLREHRQGEAT